MAKKMKEGTILSFHVPFSLLLVTHNNRVPTYEFLPYSKEPGLSLSYQRIFGPMGEVLYL